MSDLSTNDQMLEVFLFEMTSLLEQLDEILLESERQQDLSSDDVNEIFRIMHTIKGSSAMMEFNLISTVTHRLEDTFFYIRENGAQAVSADQFTRLFDLILEASDFLKSQLEAIQNGEPLAESNDDLTQRIVAFLDELSGNKVDEAPKATEIPNTQPKEEIDEPNDSSARFFHADVWFDEDCGMENLRAFMLINTLQKSCRVVDYEPSDIESNPEAAASILMQGFSVVVQTDLSVSELQSMMEKSPHVKSVSLRAVDSPNLNENKKDKPVITGDRYEVSALFEEDSGAENLRAFMLVNSLRATCGIISMDPPDIETNTDTAAVISQHGFTVIVETPQSQESLEKLVKNSLHVRWSSVKLLSKVDAKSSASSPVTPKQVPSTSKSGSTSKTEEKKPASPKSKAPAFSGRPIKQNLINVSLSKLDELMDLMGELVITESMVIRSPDLKGLGNLENFNKASRQLLKLTDELQDMVMSIRMIPVAGTFQKMHRIVRDMCRGLGKEAELVTMGEETDIDKTIIDGIGDPIMHLVRNSMDHGIEMPEERIAAGKNPTGTITLSAQSTGGEILITVSDDGKGLDPEKLLEKAKANGLLTKPASEYTDKEAFMLLTLPGFSTKENVTEYSGRGVGMDVVRKNIEKIGGTIVIESKKGHGMSVFLKIPLTLAIVDGMDVSIGGGLYTLQITSINESFKVTADQVIRDTDGNEMIVIRGNVYPIIRLYELYNVPHAITDIEEGILILVQSGERNACLFVDELIGEQQIVVKPLPPYLNRYNIKSYGISGCTILGDGNISLILDVGNIIEKVMEKR